MKTEDLPKFAIKEIVDNKDGTSSLIFDISDEDQNKFMKIMGWEQWDDEKFNSFVVESIQHLLDKERDRTNKNIKNPDFLWSQPNGE